MLKRLFRWTAYVILGLGVLLLVSVVLGTLLEDLVMPEVPTASSRTAGAIIASIAAVLLVTLLTVAAAKKWEAKWPLGVVAASLAVFVGAGLYLYGWNPTLPADAPIASGGSVSVPGVNTDGIGTLLGVDKALERQPDTYKPPQEEPDPVFAPIKVSAARHAKMCAILDPVEDAEPRRLARCP